MEGRKLPNNYKGSLLYDKLQAYRELNNMSLKDLCALLGWSTQAFYSIKKENRVVRAKTLSHIIECLKVDARWLLSNENDMEYLNVFRVYPRNVIRWLVSDEGKEEMLKSYAEHIAQKTEDKLKKEAQAVFQA